MEHPVLGTPYCAVHPCRTATLMQLLCAQLTEPSGAPDGVASEQCHTPPRAPRGQLDYLSAWWAILAPTIGVRVSAVACAAALDHLLGHGVPRGGHDHEQHGEQRRATHPRLDDCENNDVSKCAPP